MRVNVGEAKTNLSQLIARAEAGEDVEIARAGVPVVKLVPVRRPDLSPGEKFLAMRGSLKGGISIGDEFEFTEGELDEMLDAEGDPLNSLGDRA